MKAVIMAGGKGTRIHDLAPDVPKPMIKICDKPILQYQIESLVRSNINDIILVVGYKKDIIKEWFGEGQVNIGGYDVNISYIEESQPLGTAGALYYFKEDLLGNDEDFILLFGDLMLDIDFQRMIAFHRDYNSTITLFAHPNSHPYDSDLLVCNEDCCVIDILSKHDTANRKYYHNLVNAGVYCFNKRILAMITEPKKMDLEKDIIIPHIKNHVVYCYKSSEYVKDVGTPDRLVATVADVMNGIVEKRCYQNKQLAIFLDRDGTINEQKGFLIDINNFELLPRVAEAIKKINASGYLAIVVTNQPQIARGEITWEGLDEIHKKMETLLGEQGAYLDDIYFCPHHPHKGFEGEIPELKRVCNCRKPNTGLLDWAADEYNINLWESWIIGDRTVDIKCGENAAMKTVLVRTGSGGKDGKYECEPTYVADDLLEAVKYILRSECYDGLS